MKEEQTRVQLAIEHEFPAKIADALSSWDKDVLKAMAKLLFSEQTILVAIMTQATHLAPYEEAIAKHGLLQWLNTSTDFPAVATRGHVPDLLKLLLNKLTDDQRKRLTALARFLCVVSG